MALPRYLPFEPGPHRQRVGTRTLDPTTWIELGPEADDQIAEKRRVLAHRHTAAVQILDGPPGPGANAVHEASCELLDVLTRHLVATFPDRSAAGPDGAMMDPRSGTPYVDPSLAPDLHPIDLAARLVPEDLCLHLPGTDGRLRLVAASVTFPSRWRLAEKMGHLVGDIHAPVPGYAGAIGMPVDRLLDKLTPDRGLWRLNASLVDDPTLFQPVPAARRRPLRIPDGAWIRVERQTLRRLSQSGAVVFTIRTYVDPLASVADDPDVCARIAEWVRGLPTELVAQKALGDSATDLLGWLDGRMPRP